MTALPTRPAVRARLRFATASTRNAASMTIATVAAAMIVTGPALAQTAADYPAKPIRIIVPFTPGGATDVMARLIGQKLTEAWGQQVVVENRPGAGGSIGMDAAAKSAPDGYTLVVVNNAVATNEAIYPKLPFDVTRDFAPIGLVASTPMMLVANPQVGAANTRELTELLRSKGDTMAYGSCGMGGPQHFAAELYKARAAVQMAHSAYRGCNPAVADVVSGQIPVAMLSANVALPFVKAGKLRAIAVSTRNRIPSAPDVPAFRESGIAALADYDVDIWYGLMAPAATPAPVVRKLQAEVRRLLDAPDVKQRMAGGGIESLSSTGEEMMALVRADIARFREVARVAGIKAE